MCIRGPAHCNTGFAHREVYAGGYTGLGFNGGFNDGFTHMGKGVRIG